MAYKALSWNAAEDLYLETHEVMDAYQSALFVFTIQCLMIGLVANMLMSDQINIQVPNQLIVLASRFTSSILMHLTVEGDIRQGLTMMKYATNHPFEFRAPANAFIVGLMQFTGGLCAELICVFYLGTIDDPFLVIQRFIALASIAKVDDFYFAALSSTVKITNASRQL